MALIQSVDTIRHVVFGDFVTILLPWDAQLGSVAQWVAVLVALFGLLLAAFSARWAAEQWRLQYFTKEWASTIQFLIANPQFLNADTNKQYVENYEEDELLRYQFVARLSIGYVDDLYHLRTGKYLNGWLRGSVTVFVHPPYYWFLDNKDAYDEKVVKYINDTLLQEKAP